MKSPLAFMPLTRLGNWLMLFSRLESLKFKDLSGFLKKKMMPKKEPLKQASKKLMICVSIWE